MTTTVFNVFCSDIASVMDTVGPRGGVVSKSGRFRVRQVNASRYATPGGTADRAYRCSFKRRQFRVWRGIPIGIRIGNRRRSVLPTSCPSTDVIRGIPTGFAGVAGSTLARGLARPAMAMKGWLVEALFLSDAACPNANGSPQTGKGAALLAQPLPVSSRPADANALIGSRIEPTPDPFGARFINALSTRRVVEVRHRFE
jgi:hypothetical protein